MRNYFNPAAVWWIIDQVAQKKGMSASALAIKARLDPTALNPSKRFNKVGKPRSLGTDTLGKILAAGDTEPEEFTAMLRQYAEMQAKP